MHELLTAARMRAIEQAAIESGAVTGLELMERAGRGVVDAVFAEWPDLAAAPHRAVVLCGPGNNGGDGFVVARLLGEWGWELEVYLYGDAEKLPPDARATHDRWAGMGEVHAYRDDEFGLSPDVWDTSSVFVDALFGTGLTRPVTGFNEAARTTQISEWGGAAQSRRGHWPGCRCVAIDVPSGLDADSGRHLRTDDPQHESFRADLTVTFHRAKPGHYLAGGPDACGKIAIRDIGL